MLIEFSVTNFRSFRERQTLSMVAAPRLHKRENVFTVKLDGEKPLELLKVAVVYGPNASGKSNLLMALEVVLSIAQKVASTQSSSLPVAPFRFDRDLIDKPSEFEIHFIHSGMRYQFEIAATPEEIVTERLVAYPKGREMLVYQRERRDGKDQYEFGSMLLNSSESLLETWKRITPANVLFITQAVANSDDRGGVLKAPYDWLTESTLSLLNGMSGMVSASQRLLSKDASYSDQISSFLCDVDVPISSIRVEKETTAPDKSNDLREQPGLEGGLIQSSYRSRDRSKTTLTHQSALGEADLDFLDESEGTKNLIGFWLPWTTKDPSAFNARCILIVDELDGSLHPKIVAALVSKHIKTEPPSQLIFTTHDTHLMDAKLLRRDQFWITERDINGATQLRCIYEFEGREGEDIEKRYYEGRYRGLPIVASD